MTLSTIVMILILVDMTEHQDLVFPINDQKYGSDIKPNF